MNTEKYVEQILEVFDNAIKVPLSGRRVVDTDTLGELLDALKDSLPVEFTQAKAIVADRNEIIANSKKEAEAIVNAAREEAARKVANEEILRRAKEQAIEVTKTAAQEASAVRQQASEEAKEIQTKADEYSKETIASADKRARDVLDAANDFINSHLSTTLEVLSDCNAKIQKVKSDYSNNKL